MDWRDVLRGLLSERIRGNWEDNKQLIQIHELSIGLVM